MGNKVYIVDYDIPQKPAKKRVQFYRDLSQLTQYCHYEYSTLSVARTEDEYLAEAVDLHVKNFFKIGLLGYDRRPSVVSNRLRNVPLDEWDSATHPYHLTAYPTLHMRLDQIWIPKDLQ